MPLHRTNAILVDFDGTLANSIEALKTTYFEFLSCMSKQGSDAEFSELNGPSLIEIVTVLSQRYQLEGAHDVLFERYMQLLEINYADRVQPFDGAETFLSCLAEHKVRTAMVTSTPSKFVHAFVSSFAWQKYFELIVTGDEVSHSKPHPEIYLRALEMLGLPATNAIAIEDSTNGVRSASGAGLRVIAVDGSGLNSEQLQRAGAERVVANLNRALESIAL